MKSWVVCQMIGLVAGLLGLALGHDHALRTADSVAGRVWQNSMPNRKGGDGSLPALSRDYSAFEAGNIIRVEKFWSGLGANGFTV